MIKHRLYINSTIIVGNEIHLKMDRMHYIVSVLRLTIDDSLIIFDGSGHEYFAEIIQINKKHVTLVPRELTYYEKPSSRIIRIGQCLIKKSKMDLMFQKTTELGVNVIVPLVSKYSVIKIKKSNEKSKKDHWERIARSACEQCGRNYTPKIENPISIDKFINEKNTNIKIILDPTSSKNFNEINPQDRNIDILIGPEGGFNNKEIEAADKNKFVRVSMGPRTLRAETAAISAISIIQSLWGDMNADFPLKKR
tara:strand:- start:68 stop:823 length:756 start_codon:yes stop_codon:yes gene_type:complete